MKPGRPQGCFAMCSLISEVLGGYEGWSKGGQFERSVLEDRVWEEGHERARALPVANEEQALGRIGRGSGKRLHGGLSARARGGGGVG